LNFNLAGVSSRIFFPKHSQKSLLTWIQKHPSSAKRNYKWQTQFSSKISHIKCELQIDHRQFGVFDTQKFQIWTAWSKSN